ncbi:MAG TPA: XrtA system polysaccharide deacetylase [Terracidiphilus sp.]|nr:XrtA system polysaccharide deacetylase [Terracidiphilus sp.]
MMQRKSLVQTSAVSDHAALAHGPAPPDVFTIDVEDWFHILGVAGAPDPTVWDTLPTRVESNFRTLLGLLTACNIKATCFTLGWVARRFPKLIREAAELGHDIASHGYGHRLIQGLSRAQFREDIHMAKAAIEDAIGHPVLGYRAPGFSITRDTPWAHDELIREGYSYDSSVFPASHGHGGIPEAPRHPHVIRSDAGTLIEFPVSVIDTLLGPQCCFGGGYLRLFPLRLILAMAERVRRDGRGVVWYIHPREIDTSHPRLQMSLKRRFMSYVNLRSTTRKLKVILLNSDFVTFRDLVTGASEPGITAI